MTNPLTLHSFKKVFGKHAYIVYDSKYKEKLAENPLVKALWTVGKSFVIVVDTMNWELELVAGDTEYLTGYSVEEIMAMKDNFILNYPLPDHSAFNMQTLQHGMKYILSRPVHERDFIYVVYYYQALKRNGESVIIQHQSLPLEFDENKIPFIFSNIYSDIGFLEPSRVPQGMIINKHTNEVFHVELDNEELKKKEDLFSNRERQIIKLLAEGQTSRQIGTSLGISMETVRTHRKRILSKAGIGSTNQLIRYCLLNAIV